MSPETLEVAMKKRLCHLTSEFAGKPITTVSLEMPLDLATALRQAADLEGITFDALITCYAQQGLTDSKAEVKRLQFVEHVKEVMKTHGIRDKAIEEIFSKFPY